MKTKLIEAINKQYELQEDEYIVIFYGLKTLLNFLIVILSLFIISYLTLKVDELFLLLISFIPLRYIFGKIHHQTRIKCFLTSVAVINTMLYLVTFIEEIGLNYKIIGLVVLYILLKSLIKEESKIYFYNIIIAINLSIGLILNAKTSNSLLISMLCILIENFIFKKLSLNRTQTF